MADRLRAFEKHQQLFHRQAPAFIRAVLATFRKGTLKAAVAADQFGLSRSRLYALATGYGRATARKQGPGWRPGRSGGDHATPWPQPVLTLLTKRLACSPPCPYSFVASEALHLHAFKLARAQVRRGALANELAPAVPPKKVLAAVRRWQRHRIGERWQLEASPHRWCPHSKRSFPMLNRLDDCSRRFTGAKIYERELLLSYFDFLPAAFRTHGRPLQLYVDYHSLFFPPRSRRAHATGLGAQGLRHQPALRPTPQAKGQVEREPQFWQGRLPPYFASEKITDMAVANRHIDALRAHHNPGEVHRELGQTPHRAWEQARKEKRSARRPAPRCPWWDFVWSVRTTRKIGPDGRVPIGTQRRRIEKPPAPRSCCAATPTATTPCWSPPPDPQQKPVLLFTNRPG